MKYPDCVLRTDRRAAACTSWQYFSVAVNTPTDYQARRNHPNHKIAMAATMPTLTLEQAREALAMARTALTKEETEAAIKVGALGYCPPLPFPVYFYESLPIELLRSVRHGFCCRPQSTQQEGTS